MEVMDGCMGTRGAQQTVSPVVRTSAKSLTSKLLALPLPTQVEKHVSNVLMNLFQHRAEYYSYKVSF